MSNGRQPKLTTLAPSKLTPISDVMQRLETLNDWSEQPAKDAAAVLAAPATPTSPQREATATNAPAAPQTASEAPWQVVRNPSVGTHLANFRIPIELYKKLKWFGATTFGSNMTSIVIEALEIHLNKLDKDRSP